MSFEVTPVFPYLTRYGAVQEQTPVASAAPTGNR
jgi:hypothetical protein